MNDRFRFRAWNIIVNRYEYFDFHSLAKMDYDKIQWHILKFEQCTGLKDKNGRLIYEGDIVKLDSEQSDIYIAKVIHRNGCFYLSAKKWVSPFNFLKPRHWKIIGNIHENPELLEDK